MKVLSITTAFIAALFFAGIAVNFVGAALDARPGNPDFVDADGDGINDNCTDDCDCDGEGIRPQDGTGKGTGPQDGTGNGTGPRDGTGKGAGNGKGKAVSMAPAIPVIEAHADCNCDGDCEEIPPRDGTGKKLNGGRMGRGFVDEDGDGINDSGIRPQDGTGKRRGGRRSAARAEDGSGDAETRGIRGSTCDGSCDDTEIKTRRGRRR